MRDCGGGGNGVILHCFLKDGLLNCTASCTCGALATQQKRQTMVFARQGKVQKQGRGSIDIQQSQSVDYQTSTNKSKNRKSSTEDKQKRELRYWYEKIYLHNDVGLGVRYGSACR